MILRNLELRNLKCFPFLTLNFQLPPGVYHLVGDNQREPALGSNGAGKSTVWDGVSWVAFDRSLRGLRGPELCTWGAKQMEGWLEFVDVAGKPRNLYRSWSPNALAWCDEVGNVLERTDQEEVERAFGYTYETFCRAVVIGQFATHFLDLKPGPKEQVFSDVADLNRYLQLSGIASTYASNIQRDLDRAVEDEKHAEGRLEEAQAVSFEDDIKHWRADLECRLVEREHAADMAASELKEKDDLVDRMRKKIKTVREDLEDQDVVVKEFQGDERLLMERLKHVDQDLAVAKARVDAGESALKVTEDMGATCDLCKQPITRDGKHRAIDNIEGALRASRSEHKDLLRQSGKVDEDLTRQRREVTSAKRKREDLRDRLNGSQREMEHARSFARTLADRVKDLERDVTSLQNEKCPYEERQERQQAQVSDLERALTTCQRYVARKRALLDATQYWVRGFKDLRLYLMEEALTELEVEVANVLDTFGMSDWSIEFGVEKEVRSGRSIKRGFFPYVHSPHSKRRVPWEAWSGGEGHRLRLAGTMGLVSMIAARKGLATSFEVWDEPSNYLSREGVEQLLPILAARAHEQQRQVWLVDHRTGDAGGFDGVLQVTKTKDGSAASWLKEPVR